MTTKTSPSKRDRSAGGSGGSTPFFGRQAELDQFEAELRDPRGSAILVVGQQGMGKTMLLHRFMALAGQIDGLQCGAVREEVTPSDTVETVLGIFMDRAYEAGTVWKNGLPVGVNLESSPGTPRREARGVSDSGAVVGGSISFTSALYWHATTAAPLDIGNGLTGGSKAQRINNNSPPSAALPLQVAGWHVIVSPEAVLWECSAKCDDLGNWNAFELKDLISGCDGNQGWTLRKAYDVNDAGFIVGWGRRNNEPHAFLLEPQDPCCPADLDGDGDVGVNDLLILLANWGACANCGECGVECVADLDCDCDVGVEDKLILLAAWGPCEGSHHGGASDALEEAVQEMGYDDLEEYQEWLAQASGPDALASGWVLYALLTDGE